MNIEYKGIIFLSSCWLAVPTKGQKPSSVVGNEAVAVTDDYRLTHFLIPKM